MPMKRTVGFAVTVVLASAEGVAKRYHHKYENDERFKDKVALLWTLEEEGAPVERFAEVIGNKSWTHPFCDCCSEYVDRAIEFNSNTTACGKCLQHALRVFDKETLS